MAKQRKRDVFTVTLPHIDGEMLIRRLVNLIRLGATAEPELVGLVEAIGIREQFDSFAGEVASAVATADPETVAASAEESMADQAWSRLHRRAMGGDVEIIFGDGFAVQGPREFKIISRLLELDTRMIYAVWFAELGHMVELVAEIIEAWANDRDAQVAASA